MALKMTTSVRVQTGIAMSDRKNPQCYTQMMFEPQVAPPKRMMRQSQHDQAHNSGILVVPSVLVGGGGGGGSGDEIRVSGWCGRPSGCRLVWPPGVAADIQHQSRRGHLAFRRFRKGFAIFRG